MRPVSLCSVSGDGDKPKFERRLVDSSMRVGSPVDGGLSVLAACLVAAFSCALPAFVVAAPVPCGPALVVMQWLYPGCFQTWNFDDVSFDCGFLALMACVLFCERTFSGIMTLSGFPVLIVLRGPTARSTSSGAALCLFLVGFFWSYQPFAGGAAAVALSYLFMKKNMQAEACAAAIEGEHASGALLTSAARAFVGLLAQMMKHTAAAKAAANSEGYVQDSLFVIAGVLVSVLQTTPTAIAFVGINVKMILHAAAALDLHVPEIVFAIVGNCHVFAFCWTILDWSCRALGALVSWICDIGVALEWSVPGACKKQSSTFSKEKGYDSLTVKGWDGNSIDGSPSLGKGQATGRVDVPSVLRSLRPPSMLTPLCYASQSSRPLSCREKGENRVCEGGGREDKGAKSGGLNANLGTFGLRD